MGNGENNGNVEVNKERQSNLSLNSGNGAFNGPMQIQHEDNQQLNNNIINTNEVMNHVEVQANNIINLQEAQQDKKKEKDKKEIETPEQLREQLAQLENMFDYLSVKEKRQFEMLKGESAENINFVERYQRRNALVKKMSRAVSVAKTKAGHNHKVLSQDEFESLKNLAKEAKEAKDQILVEDKSLKQFEINLENVAATNKIMDELLADARGNDSGLYKNVLAAINSYRENKSPENFEKLKREVAIYIDIRTRHGRKEEKSFRSRGRVRIRRMKELAQRLEFKKTAEQYKEKAGMTQESKIQSQGTLANDMLTERDAKLNTAKDKWKDAYDKERQFAVLKEMIGFAIPVAKMTPEYIKAHPEEMRQYASKYLNAKNFVDRWDKQHSNIQGVENELQVFERKLYEHYLGELKDSFVNYEGLDVYVEACLSNNKAKIRELEKTMKENAASLTEKGEKFFQSSLQVYENKTLEMLRLNYIVGAYNAALDRSNLTDDTERLMGALKGVKVNANGEFASYEDEVKFEKDFVLMDAVYNGTTEEYREQLELYIEGRKYLPNNDDVATEAYFEQHFDELADMLVRSSMESNMIKVRKDVAEGFTRDHGADFIDRLERIDGGLGTAATFAVQFFAQMHGFNANEYKVLSCNQMAQAYEGMEGGVEGQVDAQLENLKEIIQNNKSLDRE